MENNPAFRGEAFLPGPKSAHHIRRQKPVKPTGYCNQVFQAVYTIIPSPPRSNHKSIMPFTPNRLRETLEQGGSYTASSPDGLTVLQLKHLEPLGLRYLCRLFNLSYAHARLPDIWKHAIIVPLLKPGKPKKQGTSYRPISFLCPASKIFGNTPP